MSRNTTIDHDLRERAEVVIPGGMYGHESVAYMPPQFPQFFARADGAHLWDVDDNRYIDWLCAYGPNLFGYRHLQIEEAAQRQAALGDTMTGPSARIVEFAEAMVAQVTHADWAIFCKNGTDATTICRTIARAHTRRRKIIFARGTYHGAAPWCVPGSAGIIPEDRAHHIYCEYNNAQSLADAIKEAGDDLAGIISTPFRHEVCADQLLPSLEFATLARRACDERGAVLIVDDVRAGFRLARDCSWSKIGIEPDLAAWGKAIANGHPISAVTGSDKVRGAAKSLFVTGSFWFAAVPMAAGVATMKLIAQTDYLEHCEKIGTLLRSGLDQRAADHGFTLRQTGPVQMPQILFEDDPDFRLGYDWTGTTAANGVYFHPLHNMFVSAAHTEADVQQSLQIADEAFDQLKKKRGDLGVNPVFERFRTQFDTPNYTPIG